ncbi:hypothetical protein, conserved [Eimeria maxima]|uniref:Uncharacterized protein n=1 Tax=Eimeria maxima TaxID=5804 RepID=U6M8P5_EIMMA|nr:hypothetical protein, conserved [Eimeria maxima]CDJ60411.1 hypothetical protein, conserved [Eimeria maxima]
MRVLPLEDPISCTRLLDAAGLGKPGNPHYDFCRSWMEATALETVETSSTVALFGAACVLIGLLLLEALARFCCWRAELRQQAKAR